MNAKTSILLKQIDQWFNQASDMAINAIRCEAGYLLDQHSELNEFIMAMGIAYFTDKKCNPIDDGTFDYIDQFMEVIEELNDKFNCKGYPMRLKIDLDGSLHEQNDW